MNLTNTIKPSLISFFFLCALIPLIPIVSYDYHNHQRIIQIAFLLITSLLVLTAFLGNKKPTFKLSLNKKSSVLYLIFIFFGCLSTLMSVEQSFSLLYTFHISLLIFTMYYVSTINNKKPILFIVYALLITHTSLILI
ncbi:MAG: O-antigen ligase family protein, partial [Pseudoalteromonas sp.]